jgi:hypothetical protein
MAREEQPREDLLAEAKALVERVELAVEGFDEPVMAGFRRDGCASFYFGQSPAYHFNGRRELRRAFVEPLLYKAERGRLVSLERRRTPTETILARHSLSDTEHDAFLRRCGGLLSRLQSQLNAGRFGVLRQVPETGKPVDRLRQWLESLELPVAVARSPRVG